jgi:hypothetical protein
VYELPFGKGKPLLNSAGKLEQAFFGGWNVGGILSIASGAPFSISAGGDLANVGGGTQRAQVIGDPNTGYTQSIFQWFNTAAFRTPTPFTFGNAGRNNLRGPSSTGFDFVTYKDFALTERAKLEFRAEFFNLPNHARFGIPNSNVQSGAFGRITTAGDPRDIQFALKLIF